MENASFALLVPRLYERIHYEEVGERRIILSMVVLLYNFPAVNVGFNQIRTVFMPDLEATAAILPEQMVEVVTEEIVKNQIPR